jgi:hypothetical protein
MDGLLIRPKNLPKFKMLLYLLAVSPALAQAVYNCPDQVKQFCDQSPNTRFAILIALMASTLVLVLCCMCCCCNLCQKKWKKVKTTENLGGRKKFKPPQNPIPSSTEKIVPHRAKNYNLPKPPVIAQAPIIYHEEEVATSLFTGKEPKNSDRLSISSRNSQTFLTSQVSNDQMQQYIQNTMESDRISISSRHSQQFSQPQVSDYQGPKLFGSYQEQFIQPQSQLRGIQTPEPIRPSSRTSNPEQYRQQQAEAYYQAARAVPRSNSRASNKEQSYQEQYIMQQDQMNYYQTQGQIPARSNSRTSNPRQQEPSYFSVPPRPRSSSSNHSLQERYIQQHGFAIQPYYPLSQFQQQGFSNQPYYTQVSMTNAYENIAQDVVPIEAYSNGIVRAQDGSLIKIIHPSFAQYRQYPAVPNNPK